MYEKPTRPWEGIAPSAAVLAQLDYEEMAVLAMLSWCSVTNRPVTAADLATLGDRDGTPLGSGEARTIVKHLSDLKIMSVLGMNNDRPLSVLLGGFQPRSPHRRPASAPFRAGAPTGRPAYGRGVPAQRGGPYRPGPKAPQQPVHKWVFKNRRVETGLEMTAVTPEYVMPEAAALRTRQVEIESGSFGDDLVSAAQARLDVLRGRIDLYARWLKDEPAHPTLASVLDKKRKAVPEMEYQIERAKVKKAEMEAEASSAEG